MQDILDHISLVLNENMEDIRWNKARSLGLHSIGFNNYENRNGKKFFYDKAKNDFVPIHGKKHINQITKHENEISSSIQKEIHNLATEVFEKHFPEEAKDQFYGVKNGTYRSMVFDALHAMQSGRKSTRSDHLSPDAKKDYDKMIKKALKMHDEFHNKSRDNYNQTTTGSILLPAGYDYVDADDTIQVGDKIEYGKQYIENKNDDLTGQKVSSIAGKVIRKTK